MVAFGATGLASRNFAADLDQTLMVREVTCRAREHSKYTPLVPFSYHIRYFAVVTLRL
jgi:hypothetical protein